jgi:two-component system phosphate regulon sensor histidine kinase PhoR
MAAEATETWSGRAADWKSRMSVDEAPEIYGRMRRLAAAASREWFAFAVAAGAAAFAAAVPQYAAPSLFVSCLVLALRLLLQPAARPAVATPKEEENVSGQISAQDLAAAMPDPLIIFEASSAIAYANDAARLAFGALQDGMSLLLKFRAPEVQELIGSIVAGHAGPLTAEYSERVPLEATYRITGGSVGADTGLFFLLFKDQSESRRIDRMRSDFIANASHEMRTPLASISGFVETLRGPAKDDAVARERFLKIMQDQTGRMSRLIDDLLSLSRLEMKSHAKPTSPVDLRLVVESVIDTLKPLANDLSVRIETQFEITDTVVPGDRDELFQVFENLVENACKYGQSGGRVIVSMTHVDAGTHQEICVTVRDFGPGIAEEHIPRITERFYRVDVQSSRTQKGTGLGLSIVKHILTRHNARLVIKSEVGNGAQFAVYLPVK